MPRVGQEPPVLLPRPPLRLGRGEGTHEAAEVDRVRDGNRLNAAAGLDQECRMDKSWWRGVGAAPEGGGFFERRPQGLFCCDAGTLLHGQNLEK